MKFLIVFALCFFGTSNLRGQDLAPQIYEKDWETIKNILDYKQISEKYALYYRSFFEENNWPQRSWNYMFPTSMRPIEKFFSDGCSLFPDGTVTHPNLWRDCCIRHDFAYWVGGTKEFKKQADEDLGTCVRDQLRTVYSDEELCQTVVGIFQNSIHSGVGIGGLPKFYTPWRWGFGWTNFRGFRMLTQQEKSDIKSALVVYKHILLSNRESDLGKFGKPRDLDYVLRALDTFAIDL